MMQKIFRLLLAALPMFSLAPACGTAQTRPSPGVDGPRDYRERYRPQYHFTPPANWMNDPNGLVYYAGEYHLFYQYNPLGNTWGHMSWGHAVSPDLVHWTHLPLAIPEVDGVMAFSGSAVVDWKNTSGFGRGGKPPLVAVYTGYREGNKNQSQYIAYSNDRGRSWTRYSGNPVLDIGSTEFRDPRVFWYEPQKKWVMAVSLAAEHKIRFYASSDLKKWTHLSDFGPAAAVGGVWECPDLFELPVDGDRRNSRWVLIVNLNPGSVAGGSGAQYFVGRFDGTRFTTTPTDRGETTQANPGAHWVDYGKDFYAAVSWSDVPPADGRRIWIGWMNNWQYGEKIPTSPWRSAQSVPRTLALKSTAAGIRLVQQPVTELRRLRGTGRRVPRQLIRPGSIPLATEGIAGTALEIVAELEVGTAAEVGLKVRAGKNQETVIGINGHAGRLFVDRTRSGEPAFHGDFTGRHTAPVRLENGRLRLHVFVDWSSVEVFAGSGETVITDQIFPAPESDGVALYAEGGTARLISLEAWPLRSIWSSGATKGRTGKR
jgi:fructan beta-fructosidase